MSFKFTLNSLLYIFTWYYEPIIKFLGSKFGNWLSAFYSLSAFTSTFLVFFVCCKSLDKKSSKVWSPDKIFLSGELLPMLLTTAHFLSSANWFCRRFAGPTIIYYHKEIMWLWPEKLRHSYLCTEQLVYISELLLISYKSYLECKLVHWRLSIYP